MIKSCWNCIHKNCGLPHDYICHEYECCIVDDTKDKDNDDIDTDVENLEE